MRVDIGGRRIIKEKVTTVTWTYTNSCTATQTGSATFTVTAPASESLNYPATSTVPAGQTQTVVAAPYSAWLNTASAGGGCDSLLRHNTPAAPRACGTVTTL